MSQRISILRFLLSWGHVRAYSSAPKLAKPTKFAPPSHPSRRYADPINYPGPAIKQDPKKHYPHTMPPPDTWTHYILTSRQLHFYLSLGILASLAGTVTISNFLATAPEAKDIEWDWSDPVGGLKSFGAAWRASVDAESRRTAEMRRKMVEDIEKRGEYRRAHGLETGNEGGFGGFSIKKPGEDRRVDGQLVAARAALEIEAAKGRGAVDDEPDGKAAVEEAEVLGAVVDKAGEKKLS